MSLPHADSSDLHLTQPTPEECNKIWTYTSESWRGSLTVPMYLEESLFLTTVPMAKDGGLTNWVLVDRNLPPNQRPLLCSSESFRNSSLSSDKNGVISDTIIFSIASVFCPPEYRRRGYAARLLKELAKILPTWQLHGARCAGSVLYSDIGKQFYAKFGWNPNPKNSHLDFAPTDPSKPSTATALRGGDLATLCERDEAAIRQSMSKSSQDHLPRVTILPDLDHMLWHLRKEDFATEHLFGKIPQIKGAIAGPPGRQVWVIWTHRYYDHPENPDADNVLYVLRLVVEGDDSAFRPRDGTLSTSGAHFRDQAECLKAVLRAAQYEAAEWQLHHVKLWEPSPLVERMIKATGIEHVMVEREELGIASCLWYDTEGQPTSAPLWVNNEHYAWC